MKPTKIHLGVGKGFYLASHSQHLGAKAHIVPDVVLIPHTKARYME